MIGFPSPPLVTEPSPSLRPARERRRRRSAGDAPYVELHCHSAFSFLDGASTPVELAATAAGLGYGALALTDHDGLWGSMEFAQACEGLGLRPITGAELTVALPGEGDAHLTMLVESTRGYRNLCRLLTESHSGTREGPQRAAGQPRVSLTRVAELAEGLVCLSGCAGEGAVARSWERGRPARAEEVARRLLGAFGRDRFRVELQRPYWRRDRARNRWLADLAERLRVPAVATGNVHSHGRSRSALQDALVAVRLGTTLEGSEAARRGNSSSAMVSPQAMAARFGEHSAAVAETVRLADRLRFDLTRELGYRYPGAEDPGTDGRLAAFCRGLLEDRYAGTRERPEAERRLAEELAIIRRLGLSGFFLLHRDLLELAREVAVEVRGPESARAVLPPGRGRGSSVSSIVCYLTGLSHVDPVKAGLFTGRFLNEEVTSMPDIDLDFPRDIREKLIPRVHERYGADRSALVAAFPTYRSRGAIRDLGKALGLPAGEIERAARAVDFHGGAEEIERDIASAVGERRAATLRWRHLAALCGEALGLPRHPSQHPGGMVISTRPLIEICPVVPAAMEERQIVQWDKDSCADAGFLKIDLLGLGMLSAVERCVEEIGRARGERLDLSRIPLDDPETFASIRRAETTGVFQIESRAQMQMLPRTLPEDLDDLTVQVALVRPGPIQGGAIHPYIERRRLLREDPSYEVPYDHPSLEPVLRDTLGAIVFQEQVIEVAMALSGFSSGEAEGLRRAMSRKRSEAALRAYRDRFVGGAVERGVPRPTAERVFRQIQGFSGFGFPKAHSVAFGLLAYQSAWLRVHYGPEFLASLLNEQPMGFYPPDALVHEAQRRAIPVLPADVNRSHVLCRAEGVEDGRRPSPSPAPPGVRIGLGYVKGVKEDQMRALVREREERGAFKGIADLASRSGASRDGLERLAWAGALDSIAGDGARRQADGVATPGGTARREAFWRLGTLTGSAEIAAGTQLALPLAPPRAPELPPIGPWERVVADYGATGMTLGDHPLELLRPELPGIATKHGPGADRRRGRGRGGGIGGRPPAPGDREGGLLRPARGRDRDDQPGGAPSRLRALQGDRANRAAAARTRAAWSAARERSTWSSHGSPSSSGPTSRRPRYGRSSPPGRETGREPAREAMVAELRAVAPAAHSFGRRGR